MASAIPEQESIIRYCKKKKIVDKKMFFVTDEERNGKKIANALVVNFKCL